MKIRIKITAYAESIVPGDTIEEAEQLVELYKTGYDVRDILTIMDGDAILDEAYVSEVTIEDDESEYVTPAGGEKFDG